MSYTSWKDIRDSQAVRCVLTEELVLFVLGSRDSLVDPTKPVGPIVAAFRNYLRAYIVDDRYHPLRDGYREFLTRV